MFILTELTFKSEKQIHTEEQRIFNSPWKKKTTKIIGHASIIFSKKFRTIIFPLCVERGSGNPHSSFHYK